METIYKYELHNAFKVDAFPKISMPKDAQILKVESVRNIACIYAVVNTDEQQNVIRDFCLLPTGGDMSAMKDGTPVYLGTVSLNNDLLMLHIFELVKELENDNQENHQDNTELFSE